MTHDRRKKILRTKSEATVFAVVAVALFTSACAGALFKVKPVVELPPLAGNIRSANAGGITIRVAPLLTDEESQDLFEANLPLSGVLPLRVELDFESGLSVELKRARFQLHDGEGGEWKLLTQRQAVSRILKANGVYAYNPHSRKQFEEEFSAYGVDLKTPLTAPDRRQGFLFFARPKTSPVESPRGLTLKVERVPQPVEISLN